MVKCCALLTHSLCVCAHEQWNRRDVILQQTLHLRQYQKETKEVYEWLENVGRPFLTAANSIGIYMAAEGLQGCVTWL